MISIIIIGARNKDILVALDNECKIIVVTMTYIIINSFVKMQIIWDDDNQYVFE